MWLSGVDLEIIDEGFGNVSVIPRLCSPLLETANFAYFVESPGTGMSVMVDGYVTPDGHIIYNQTAAFAFGSNANARGFWSDYWYFLSGGSAPADPAWLNYGSEAGFIVAGVATGGAGLVAVTGVGAGVTLTAGGVATAVGTEMVDTVAEEGISYATDVPVILPMSPIDLVQDTGKLIIRRHVRAPSPRIANPADEIAGNFNPSDYVDDGYIPAGPYFGVDDAGQAVADDFAEAYGNGIQEIFATSDKFDEMLQSGTIVPDGYYPDGTAVYAPSELLEQFNVDILTGPTNIYHPPKP